MTQLLVLGPPAWLAISVAATQVYRTSLSGSNVQPWKVLVGYACLIVLQHVVHLLCSWAILTVDLRWGELSGEDAWVFHGRAKTCWSGSPRPATFLVEAEGPEQADIVGVLCGKPGPVWEGCCARRKKAGKPRKQRGKSHPTASASGLLDSKVSLWHATVHPQFRNHGVATLLLRHAEAWAREAGASKVEVLSLSTQAKAACYNAGFVLLNERTGRLPLMPAVLSKDLQ